MGEFLSTPIKDKITHDDENSFVNIIFINFLYHIQLRFGSCSMQGWRKRMEDSHITDLDIGPSNKTQIFGVFDGHGGSEVAKFVANHFTEEFLKNQSYLKNDIKKALEENYQKMDSLMLQKEQLKDTLKN